MTTVECYQNCDVSSVEIIKDLRNKLESYTNEYNIYKTAQLHLDTLNFENNIGKVLKRDVYFQGQTLDTINGINYYLIFVYWFLFIILIIKFVFDGDIRKHMKLLGILLIIPFLMRIHVLSYISKKITHILKQFRNYMMSMLLPIGEFIVYIISTLVNLFGSVVESIFDIFFKILNIFPNLAKAFKRLFLNIAPDICKDESE